MSHKNNEQDLGLGNFSSRLKTYVMGYIGCIILTLAAFFIARHSLNTQIALVISVVALAIIQLFVQLKCFLHVGFQSGSRWNLSTLIFTAIIIIALVGGSLWIMFSLDTMMSF